MKKKQNNYVPYIAVLGAGVLAFVFRKKIGEFLGISKKSEALPEETPGAAPAAAPGSAPGQTPAIEQKKLSKLGTAKEKLKFFTMLAKGDSGQEVAKLQQILNRISEIYKTIKVTEDGEFGNGTEKKLNDILGRKTANLQQAYTMLFAIYKANQDRKLKNWYKDYFVPAVRNNEDFKNPKYVEYRNNYFKSNTAV